MFRYKRRILALITALLILVNLSGALAVSPSDYDMTHPEALVAEHLFCESALLVDADTGEILFTNNSRVRMYPASTTKIVTLILGIESNIAMDEVVTIPAEAAQIASGSSVIPVKPGDQMRYKDLLYSFMMTSGNDGANAIAMLTSGSIESFVERMNAWATEVGCVGTHFTNAHGLHNEEHYTTAQDLALMTRAAMKNEIFADIVACANYEMVIRRNGENINRTVKTRNTLLLQDQKYYYADCIGVKTGHTGKAGYCFVGAAQRDGKRVISVVLNCPKDEHKWYDSAKLYEYGFTRYTDLDLNAIFAGVQERIATVQVSKPIETDPYGGRLKLNLSQISNPAFTRKIVAGSDASRQFAIEDFAQSAVISITDDLVAPISEGEVLGTISYTSPYGESVTANLTAARSIEKQPDPTPTPEPTPEPIIVLPGRDSTGNSRDGLIMIALFILLLILVFALIAALIASARRKRRRRRMMEARRRAQMRRRQQMNGRNASGRSMPSNRRSSGTNRRRHYDDY